MAKQPLIVKKISSEKNRSIFFKFLNKYLSGDQKIKQHIQKILDMNDDYFIIHRLYYSLQYFPNVMKFIDKYMNDLYKKYELIQYLRTFKFIVLGNNISPNTFCYIKRQFSDYTKFKENISTLNLTNDEIKNLYRLWNNGIINEIDITELKNQNKIFIDEIISDKQIFNLNEQIIKEEIINIEPSKINIDNLNNKLKKLKTSRAGCKACPGYANELQDIKINENFKADIVIISQYPLNGSSYNTILQELFSKLKNYDYFKMSLIACSPDKENIKNQILCCDGFRKIILNNTTPKLYILFGSDAKKHFGLKGPMNQITGKLIENKYFMFDDINSIISNLTKYKRFTKDLLELENIILNYDFGKKPIISDLNLSNEIYDQFNIPKDRILSSPNKDVSLFEIKTVGDYVIQIFKHIHNNKKYYMIQPYLQNIYIKNGEFKDCEYISNVQMDGYLIVNKNEKNKLLYKLHKQIDDLILL